MSVGCGLIEVHSFRSIFINIENTPKRTLHSKLVINLSIFPHFLILMVCLYLLHNTSARRLLWQEKESMNQSAIRRFICASSSFRKGCCSLPIPPMLIGWSGSLERISGISPLGKSGSSGTVLIGRLTEEEP